LDSAWLYSEYDRARLFSKRGSDAMSSTSRCNWLDHVAQIATASFSPAEYYFRSPSVMEMSAHDYHGFACDLLEELDTVDALLITPKYNPDGVEGC